MIKYNQDKMDKIYIDLYGVLKKSSDQVYKGVPSIEAFPSIVTIMMNLTRDIFDQFCEGTPAEKAKHLRDLLNSFMDSVDLAILCDEKYD